MNDQQQPKLYRQQIEEWEQQRQAAVAKSDADFNNPAWLQQALELEHDAAVLARKQHNAIAGAYETLYIESQQMASDLAAARAEVARLREALGQITIHCNESKTANYQERVATIRGIVNGLALWRS